MKKSLYNFFEWVLFALLLTISLFLAFGKDYSTAVLDGIKLWACAVLPALFPYFFITAILSSLSVTSKVGCLLAPVTTKLFRVSGTVGYPFLISLISGYPVGAKMVSDLKQNSLISDVEAVRASALCSTSSPMFLLVSVGSITFNSPEFGLRLFICHILAVICVGIVFSFYKKSSPPTAISSFASAKKVDNVFYESVYSSVLSVLTVGGIITLFYLLTEILLSLSILSPLTYALSPILGESGASGLILGLFECTKGLKELSLSGIGRLTLPIACALCSFGGLSVIMQSVAFLKKAKIKTAPFVISKLISAVFGFIFGLLFSLLTF